MKPQPVSGAWPTRDQQQLLRAALLGGEAGRGAWKAWKAQADIRRLDPSSFRVLPLLYENLRALGIDDPLMPLLKDAYRECTYRNLLLIDRVLPILRALHELGVEAMVVKGAAVGLHHYHDIGRRSLVEFDLLIRRCDLPTVSAWLATDTQWKMISARAARRRAWAADWYRNPDGFVLHLHWHVLPDVPDDKVDEAFWTRARARDYHGVSAYVLDATDQVLYACVQGARWARVVPLLWIADAVTVMRDADAIDWERMIESAQELHLVARLHAALSHLARVVDAPVPRQVLERLAALRVVRAERSELRIQLQRTGWLGQLPANWYRYRLRIARTRNPLRAIMGFLEYQAGLLGLDSVWALPRAASRKAIAKLRAHCLRMRGQAAGG